MCSNLVESMECYMDEIFDTFDDFLKKSLLVVSISIGTVVLLLIYVTSVASGRGHGDLPPCCQQLMASATSTLTSATTALTSATSPPRSGTSPLTSSTSPPRSGTSPLTSSTSPPTSGSSLQAAKSSPTDTMPPTTTTTTPKTYTSPCPPRPCPPPGECPEAPEGACVECDGKCPNRKAGKRGGFFSRITCRDSDTCPSACAWMEKEDDIKANSAFETSGEYDEKKLEAETNDDNVHKKAHEYPLKAEHPDKKTSKHVNEDSCECWDVYPIANETK